MSLVQTQVKLTQDERGWWLILDVTTGRRYGEPQPDEEAARRVAERHGWRIRERPPLAA